MTGMLEPIRIAEKMDVILSSGSSSPPSGHSLAVARVRAVGSSLGAGDVRGCWSHKGCRPLTTGIAAKLYSDGGDVVAHSSESAPHGFGPAGVGRRLLQMKLTSESNTPNANTNE